MTTLSLADLPSPGQDEFNHQSEIHGAAHVARVIVLGQVLGQLKGASPAELRINWAASYIHDLRREDDGECRFHGEWAADHSAAHLRPFLRTHGLSETEIEIAEEVSRWHARPRDPKRTHPHYDHIAFFKDADGLDRVRINDLDPSFLRNPEALRLTGFAEALFNATDPRFYPDTLPPFGHDIRQVRKIAEGMTHFIAPPGQSAHVTPRDLRFQDVFDALEPTRPGLPAQHIMRDAPDLGLRGY